MYINANPNMLEELATSWNTFMHAALPSSNSILPSANRSARDDDIPVVTIGDLDLTRKDPLALLQVRLPLLHASPYPDACLSSEARAIALEIYTARGLPDEVDSERISLSNSVWLLSLIRRHSHLIQRIACCFLEFNRQYLDLARAQEGEVDDLRERHRRWLSSLLEVAVDEVVVDGAVMEWLVGKHEAELRSLRAAHAAASGSLERELQRAFNEVLRASALEEMRAATHVSSGRDSLFASPPSKRGVRDREGGADYPAGRRAVDEDSDPARSFPRYNPILSVSSFARRLGASASPVQANADVVVPMRSVLLENPLYGHLKAPRPGDYPPPPPLSSSSFSSPLRQLVVNISPVSCLTSCLASFHPGGAASSQLEEAAAAEHLRRLAHSRHSMLLIISPERSPAREILHPTKAHNDVPELLLGARTGLDGFSPLPGHAQLKVNVNTRLWGANIVLLWELPPTFAGAEGGVGESPSSLEADGARARTRKDAEMDGVRATCGRGCLLPTVVEDALRLAFAWEVDMFSVAVLESPPTRASALPFYHHCQREIPTRKEAPAADEEGCEERRMLPYLLSMDVLRQIQYGLAKMLLETSTTRPPHSLPIREERFFFGGGDCQQISYNFPKKVRFAEADDSARGVSKNEYTKTDEGMKDSIPTKKGGYSEGPFIGQTSSTAASALVKNVMSNLPMAIRVFLPIPEECFSDEDEMGSDPPKGDHNQLNAQAAIPTRRRLRSDAVLKHTGSESVGGVSSPATASILPFFLALYGSKSPEEPSIVLSERTQSNVRPVRPTVKRILNSYFGNSAQLK